MQNKFYILEREQGTGNREQIRNTEIFLFSKNVKLILLRYLYLGFWFLQQALNTSKQRHKMSNFTFVNFIPEFGNAKN
ncbi:hypothetical protein CUN59_00320 [Cuspidothrix issatschenkoi CHARLIE-1]|uniref:Uncharacterized protein n=1 Tax=Cuspidothrix issatschenkoi CHARLIE-1 TaxID=2052836 RepID=A0A2S6CZW2_9CYAN|nr:hypothetical protein CUN59_00320 [Cuspidothrix issatschenkoi CHARLIE-1]